MRKIEKPWGYEIIWAKTDKYIGKILHVCAGKRLSLQYHKIKDETLYVQKGCIELLLGKDEAHLEKKTLNIGQSQHIPAGMLHRMTALSDSDVFEASTPELDDVVRLQDDFNRIT